MRVFPGLSPSLCRKAPDCLLSDSQHVSRVNDMLQLRYKSINIIDIVEKSSRKAPCPYPENNVVVDPRN